MNLTFTTITLPSTYMYNFASFALLSTLRPDNLKRTHFNLMLKYNCLNAKPYLNLSGEDLPTIQECKIEGALDTQFSLYNNYWLTMGLGILKDKAFDFWDNKHITAVGLSLSKYRPKRFLSRPSLGILYTPEYNTSQLLFSTTFNEL